ncbi:hypothetical protein [Streptomyces sp. NPDC047928]|uniref:hypothetical protein n=1 Tax=unclassified Streptomyces TaxID=2593676 RepID=UPI003713180B
MLTTDQGGTSGTERRKRLDLSAAQVAGSAVAAVLAAKLAANLGVYGTVIGAGVISVVATCGGSVLQHLLTRTGERVRGVTAARGPAPNPQVPPPEGEFGAPTTHGSRLRGRRRSAIAAAVVFGLAMAGITTYELISGQDLSGTRGTTTFGAVVRGGGAPPSADPARDTADPDATTAPGRGEQPDQERDRKPSGSGGTADQDPSAPPVPSAPPSSSPTPSDPSGPAPRPTPTPAPASTPPPASPGPSASQAPPPGDTATSGAAVGGGE